MATQTAGIQQLLAAEKKAAETVGEARKRRVKRLKQAKDEAAVEIESFKNEKEKQHKILEQEILGSKSSNTDSIKIKTDQQIAEMTLAFNRNSKEVLEYVLEMVKNVQPAPHENQR